MNEKLINEAFLPHERFLEKGAAALSDEELISIILRTGTKNNSVFEISSQVLHLGSANRPGLLGLYDISLEQLMSVNGIGKVGAVKVLALAEISKRIHRASAKITFQASSPSSVADYFMEDLRHLKNETVVLACMDTRGQLISTSVLSTGSVNASLISPRTIFLEALLKKAVYIILIHNHPSGDPSPSKADIEITEKVKKSGDEIEIPLLDHIIIGDKKYYSFQESSNIFSDRERIL